MGTFSNIVQKNQRFWKKQSARMTKQMQDSELFEKASEKMRAQDLASKSVYERKCWVTFLEEAHAERARTYVTAAEAFRARQRRNATQCRGKLDVCTSTLGQIIEMLVYSPDNRTLSAKRLWQVLLQKLRAANLGFVEPSSAGASGHFEINYPFHGRLKSLSFKTFANKVSELRNGMTASPKSPRAI